MSQSFSIEQTDAMLEALGPDISTMFPTKPGKRLKSFQDELIGRMDILSSLVPSLVDTSLPSLIGKSLSSTIPVVTPGGLAPSPSVFSEPRVLVDVSFAGGHIHLRSFVHIIPLARSFQIERKGEIAMEKSKDRV
ncbi:hypothetical protein CROQUDRAFT_101403 [Cronartium quercuum f. sp. fusiforme G11]|uniref:Uncharacterized protein n=1 Tax=Cronartium quercuum f. sp. fusiforme G11 TaxID=708437 RepID=A0A9P6N5X1_9BASI|nr:hypothetical protein CROQUDRAFT_101403 [Cronartium quercuum f. sp. fusiforme G11]